MCLSPITIVNPTKYVSLRYRDQYLLQVPCGHCAECQATMSNQWLYRSYYEFMDCIQSGGYVLFDGLSYRNEDLPHISDFVQVDRDYPCFNSEHLKLFFKRLRIQVKRAGYTFNVRYFVSSEYGTSDEYRDDYGRRRKSTHRPHYHLLLFVYGDVPPLVMSQSIAKAWIYGRTDGVPYKTKNYVMTHNYIADKSLSAILRTSNYVTKYVQKSCVFQREIDRRINEVMHRIAEDMSFVDGEENWLESYEARDYRIKLKRLCNQFHRQSLHFGETALRDMDINELYRTGVLIMPHYKSLKIPVVLPTYYKRKLFYRLVEIDGAKSWQLNEDGVTYKRARQSSLFKDLKNRFECVCLQYHLDYNCTRLADYVLNYRGRLRGDLPPSVIEERLEHVDLFNYVTIADKRELGSRGLSIIYYGNSSAGYQSNYAVTPMSITIRDFISQYVILDDDRERELANIYYLCDDVNKGKQDAFELKQVLKNKLKLFV